MILSVVISTRNRLDSLFECLQTISLGSSLPDEVVIIDQGDLGKRYSKGVNEKYPFKLRVVLQLEEGASRGRNLGVKLAKGGIVCFIDDDCRVSKDWVKQIKEIMDDKKIKGVFGKVLSFNSQDKVGVFCPSVTEVNINGEIILNEGVVTEYDWFVCSSNMVLRREVARKYPFATLLGPGTPRTGSEDLELCYRLIRDGKKILYVPGLVVYHDKWIRQRELSRMHLRSELGYAIFHQFYYHWGDNWAKEQFLRHKKTVIGNQWRYLLAAIVGCHPKVFCWEIYMLWSFFRSWRKGFQLAASYYKRSLSADLSTVEFG